MQMIFSTIRKLGATTKYKGYAFIADSIKFAMNNQNKPLTITKNIYPHIAKKYDTTPINVERDIRTIINICWENNKKAMEEIAGRSLIYKPTNSEFIDMVACYIINLDNR